MRSFEDHTLVLWVNLPTCGVTPAAKQDFFITSISNLLSSYKRNSVAIIVHSNRAGDAARTLNDHDDIRF